MTQHTPGPWKVSHEPWRKYGEHAEAVEFAVHGADGSIVCDVNGARTPEPHSVAAANAQLIALAPEMLAEIELIVEFVKTYTEDNSPTRLAQQMLTAGGRLAEIVRKVKGDA